MMEPPPTTRSCPTCGHAYAPGAEVCPQCGRDDANPFVSPIAAAKPARGIDWRLLLGVTATLGIAAAMGLAAPGLAIAWALIATPALVRASTVIKRRREAGLPVAREDRFHAGVASVGVALLAGIAGSVAFVVICFPMGLPFFEIGPDVTRPNVGMICAFVGGFAAAAAVGFYTMKRFWPPRAAGGGHG